MTRDHYSTEYRSTFPRETDAAPVTIRRWRCAACSDVTTIHDADGCNSYDFDADRRCGGELVAEAPRPHRARTETPSTVRIERVTMADLVFGGRR